MPHLPALVTRCSDPVTAATLAASSVLLLSVPLHLWLNSRLRSRKSKKRRKQARRHQKSASPSSTLPVVVSTLALLDARTNLHDWTANVCKQLNGRPFVVKTIGLPDTLVLCSPQAFVDVLKLQVESFPKGPLVLENLRDLLGDGLLAADGVQWTRQRATTSNLLGMRALRDTLTSAIERHVTSLHDSLRHASAASETVDLSQLLGRFTLQTFVEMALGTSPDCLADDQKPHAFETALERAQRAIALRFVRPSWYWKTQRWLGVGVEGELQQDLQVIHATVLEMVESYQTERASVAPEESIGATQHLLSLFMDGVHDEQLETPVLCDLVVNFLVATRDTTAQALSWFFYEVSRHPRVEKRLRQELQKRLPELRTATPTLKQTSALVYLEAALKETLRLHPTVPVSTRSAARDVVLSDGTFVAAGSRVCLPLYAMGRMPFVWGADADEFRPERWLDPKSGRLASVSAYKFVAFNAGPRMCPGMNVAGLQMKLVAASLLSRFHVHVESPERADYELSLTLPVKGALKVRVACVLTHATSEPPGAGLLG